jgi:hypothetical protein
VAKSGEGGRANEGEEKGGSTMRGVEEDKVVVEAGSTKRVGGDGEGEGGEGRQGGE